MTGFELLAPWLLWLTGHGVRGRALGPNGLPIGGATVRICAGADREPFSDEPSGTSSAIESRADGTFAWPWLPIGTYGIRVESEGLRSFALATEVAVPPAPGTELGDLRLAPGGVIAGMVRDAATGLPLSGATILLRQEDQVLRACWEDPASARRISAETDARGSFRLAGVDDTRLGQLQVRGEARGYLPIERRFEFLTAASATHQVISLPPVAELYGRILQESGAPLAGIRIRPSNIEVRPRDNSSETGYWDCESAAEETTTDLEGRFRLAPVARTELRLTPEADGVDETGWVVRCREPRCVVGSLVATAVPSQRFSVRVLDSNGRALAKIPIALHRYDADDRDRELMTDEAGAATLDRLPRGIYEATVSDPEFQRHSERVTVGEEPIDLEIRLSEPRGGRGVVEGRVVDEAGKSLACESVYFGEISDVIYGVPSRRTTCDAEGSFRLEGLPEGFYGVRVGLAGWGDRLQERRVAVAGNAVTTVTVPLARLRTVRGRVLPPLPEPIERIAVRVSTRDATVTHDGSFVAEGVLAGAAVARASVDGSSFGSERAFEVPEEGPVPFVEISFAESRKLEGVARLRGRGLRGANVRLEREEDGGNEALYASTDFEGRYAFPHAPLGPWRISLRLNGLAVEKEIDLQNDSVVDFDLSGSFLSGVVLRAGDREPIAGVWIPIQRVDEATGRSWDVASATSRGDGSFEAGPLPAGSYRLRAGVQGGFTPLERLFALVDDQDLTGMELSLEGPSELEVRVTAPANRALGNVYLRLRDRSGNEVAETWRVAGTGEDITWTQAPRGAWTLEVSSGPRPPAALPVEIPGPPVDVELQPGGALHADVQEDEDRWDPLGQMRLDLESLDGHPLPACVGIGCTVCWVRLRACGRSGLAPGAYRWTITADDGRVWQGTSEVRDGETTVFRPRPLP
jgi:hypothetical protein